MAICRECKEDVVRYQTIETKRKTVIYICDRCMKKLTGKEADNARHNEKSI